MKRLLTALLLLGIGQTAGWGLERFDRSAVLPELAKAARSAQAALADYRKANKTAEKAAQRLARGFGDLPQDKRDEAKAQELVRLEASLRTMSEKLGTFHSTLSGIQDSIEHGLVVGLGEVRERLDSLVTQFSSEITQKQRSSSALLRLAEISPDAVGETEAQKLNNAMDQVEQRRRLITKLQERRERISAIHETIQQKIESIHAVTSAVEARMEELKAEALMVETLKKEHQVELVASEVFGLGRPGDPARIFDSRSSQALDEMLGRSARSGLSERETLRRRLGDAGSNDGREARQ